MNHDSSSDQIPWDALARYVAGELSEADAQTLEAWLAATPDRTAVLRDAERLWQDATALRQTWDPDAALMRIKRPAEGPVRVIRLPAFYRTPSRWQRARRIAGQAAAAVLVAGGLWFAARHTVRAPDAPIETAEMHTQPGQRASLRLPDGSQVILGPASTLHYTVAADRGPRRVRLDGEAYFTVTHDAARPFTVQTARGVATDLGTKFSVRAYHADSLVDVAVEEGRVALAGADRDSVVLTAGDLGHIASNGRLAAERQADLSTYLAWTEGRLEFHDTPLRDAVVRLGRWYDLDVRLTGSIGDRRLSAAFTDESAPEALRLIAASLELRMNRRGKLVILTPQ